ncbi:MAG: hypothetical protein ACLP5V_04735 [Candidatus Bathyarchaeia archaeon]
MRTLEKPDTSILNGTQIYQNDVRPHTALYGNTPAESKSTEKTVVDRDSER